MIFSLKNNSQKHASYEIVGIKGCRQSQIYCHKEGQHLPPSGLPPGNSRRGPQVTGTQGRRGTKSSLVLPSPPSVSSNLSHRINSCQKCTSGQILLTDPDGTNTITFQTWWKIFSVCFSTASSSILRCCGGAVLRDNLCMWWFSGSFFPISFSIWQTLLLYLCAFILPSCIRTHCIKAMGSLNAGSASSPEARAGAFSPRDVSQKSSKKRSPNIGQWSAEQGTPLKNAMLPYVKAQGTKIGQ